MGHVGPTPQAVTVLGGYAARGRSDAEAEKIVGDARALDEAGAFAIVLEGVLEPIAIEATAVSCPTIGIGASAQCDGQVLVTEDMLGMFERVPRFVKKYADIAGVIENDRGAICRGSARARSFPTRTRPISPRADQSGAFHGNNPQLLRVFVELRRSRALRAGRMVWLVEHGIDHRHARHPVDRRRSRSSKGR